MIQAENLSKSFLKSEKKKKFEFLAVNNVSITVKEGEIVGILGPNGAGKTTLLRMLSLLMKPTTGIINVVLKTEKIEDILEIKRNIGYLSANTKLYNRLSTRELLHTLAEIYHLSKEESKSRVEEIIQVLDMNSFCDNRIEKLSTGQMQRASIARCLIHNPAIYIFDEPTLG